MNKFLLAVALWFSCASCTDHYPFCSGSVNYKKLDTLMAFDSLHSKAPFTDPKNGNRVLQALCKKLGGFSSITVAEHRHMFMEETLGAMYIADRKLFLTYTLQKNKTPDLTSDIDSSHYLIKILTPLVSNYRANVDSVERRFANPHLMDGGSIRLIHINDTSSAFENPVVVFTF